MPNLELNYNILIEKAMRDVIKYALKKAQKIKNENFSFVFTINTKHKNVILPNYIKKQYPNEITLILQHQFSNLNVKNNSFSVNLTFNGKSEEVVIPFNSILFFFDQVAGIELKFNNDNNVEFVEDYDDFYDLIDYTEEANNNIDINNNLIKFVDFKK